jgi:hypothetical protein
MTLGFHALMQHSDDANATVDSYEEYDVRAVFEAPIA